MADFGFYHLTRSTVTQALPQLLTRTLSAKQRAVVLAPDAAAMGALSTALWLDPAWLPHGTVADGDPDLQPIWFSTTAEPLNGGRFLFLVQGATTDRMDDYVRIFDLFDGNDPQAVAAARTRWKAAKDAGHELNYWQQTETGWRKSP